MLLSEHLDALERGCLDHAPHLVDHVRRARQAVHTPVGTKEPPLVSALVDDPLTLEPADLDLPGDETNQQVARVPTVGTQRYDDLGLIGTGGMGEVRRVRDRELNRTLAMKVIKAPLMRKPGALARFMEEAQATAQLQHPAIVPVYDLGQLTDGRVYFTMKDRIIRYPRFARSE